MLRLLRIFAAVSAVLLGGWGAARAMDPMLSPPLERVTCTLADSLPGGKPTHFERADEWTTPHFIRPGNESWARKIESPIALAAYTDDEPQAAPISSQITLLSPPDGVRRRGDARRTTALWAEVETPDWYIADTDWTPHLRHSTRTATIGFLAGALVANSMPYNGDQSRTVDMQVHDWYQTQVRSEQSDSIAKTAKLAGEGIYLFPATIALYATTRFYQDGPIFGPAGNYSDRLVRSYASGAPFLLAGQFITGASRPYETADQSNWKFLDDNNGVSGHAFVGAMPFLVAAQMSENWLWKGTFYAASGMTAWSRVNDGAHFSSQIFLGWSLAYAVCCTVNEQPFYSDRMAVMPVVSPDMTGIAIVITR